MRLANRLHIGRNVSSAPRANSKFDEKFDKSLVSCCLRPMRRNFYVLTPKFFGAIVNSIATHALLLFFSFVVKIKVANSCQLLKKVTSIILYHFILHDNNKLTARSNNDC